MNSLNACYNLYDFRMNQVAILVLVITLCLISEELVEAGAHCAHRGYCNHHGHGGCIRTVYCCHMCKNAYVYFQST